MTRNQTGLSREEGSHRWPNFYQTGSILSTSFAAGTRKNGGHLPPPFDGVDQKRLIQARIECLDARLLVLQRW
jgi:hypothetical protein